MKMAWALVQASGRKKVALTRPSYLLQRFSLFPWIDSTTTTHSKLRDIGNFLDYHMCGEVEFLTQTREEIVISDGSTRPRLLGQLL